MPSHVKIFWWLGVTAVACWVLVTAWFLVFPSAHHLAALAQLPPQLREAIRRLDIRIAIVSTSVWCGAILGLAWLAAFRRRNWARWAFAALFLIRKSVSLLVAAAYHQLDGYMAELARANWADPLGYVDPVLMLAAIAFVFSGNARAWFDRQAAMASGAR